MYNFIHDFPRKYYCASQQAITRGYKLCRMNKYGCVRRNSDTYQLLPPSRCEYMDVRFVLLEGRKEAVPKTINSISSDLGKLFLTDLNNFMKFCDGEDRFYPIEKLIDLNNEAQFAICSGIFFSKILKQNHYYEDITSHISILEKYNTTFNFRSFI